MFVLSFGIGNPDITRDPLGPRLFPALLAACLALLGATQLAREYATTPPAESDPEEPSHTGPATESAGLRYQPVLAMGVTASYAVLMPILHYAPATIAATAGIAWLSGERSRRMLVFFPLSLTAVLLFLFGSVLNVRLP